MASINSTQALSLLGKTLDLVVCIPSPEGPDFDRFLGTIMAVQVPAPGMGIEWSALIRQEGLDHLEFIELDRLYFG